MKNFILAAALLFSPLLASAQLGQFGGGGNNGAAAATFTFTGVLASIPATCTVGQLAFITNATAGQNIYECAATNTWTQQLSGGASFPLTSPTANPASAGSLRLANNTDKIEWNNAAGNANLAIYFDASNVFQIPGTLNVGSLTTGGTGADTYTALADPACSTSFLFWASTTTANTFKYCDGNSNIRILANQSGTPGGIPYYSSATTQGSSAALTSNVLIKGGGAGAAPAVSLITENGTTATYTGTGGYVAPKFVTDGTACVGCGGGIDGNEGTAPPAATSHDVLWADSTAHRYKMSNNNATAVQVVASGADINTSDQVTVTHLAAALPVNQGGSGTTSTLTGVVRGGSPLTAAELSGDCATSGSNAVICTQINGANFTVNTSGLPTKVDGITTAGQGVDIVQCITSAKVETGADAAVLSCTPASAVGGYEVCVSIDVSAANTATLGWTATWTNTKTNANAPTNLSLFQMGVAAPALTFTAAANNSYYSCVPIGVSAAGTAIVVKTTFSGTSIAYNVSAWIKRVI